MSIEAVTFDFWNTLVFEERGHLRGLRLDAWAGLLEEAGFAVEREALGAAFDRTWEFYVQHWRSNQQYRAVEAAEQTIEDLGFHVPPKVRVALIEAFCDAGARAELHTTDGIADCLDALQGAGMKLGIICDVGMTASHILRAYLDGRGLLERFDHWSFSDEVGFYKPSPQIFEHALGGLGVTDPARAAHVGDLRRTDVAGAKAMGMLSVRYMGIEDDDSQPEPEADHVIVHHAELPALLGLVPA